MKNTATRKRAKKAARPRRETGRLSEKTQRTKRSGKAPVDSVAWIRELAAPYLKGYKPVAAKAGSLQGYWFLVSAQTQLQEGIASAGESSVNGRSAGFFVGYLIDRDGYSFLAPEPPECLVFAWVSPVGGSLHRQLVRQSGSLVRKTFEYIRWLTHRPPRFVFQEMELPAMARHASMRGWPAEKHEHLSRNFFIETLAWLVRSGLVRKLKEGSN